MKRCTECGETKPFTEFHKYADSGLYKGACNNCCTAKQRDRWRQQKQDSKEKRRGWIDELKSKPCTDCGCTFDPVCMDFDHIGTDKTLNVSQMVARNFAKGIIEQEIAKCELVCANCHRLRTKKRHLGIPFRPE